MASGPHDMTLRKLFGGAMECLLPAAYVDVSHLRQVPDHQEVFADREVGISVVVEVLSFEEGVPSDGTENGGGGGSSARYFFDDLASANGALSSTCDFCVDMTDSIMPKLASYSKAVLAGRQTVAKFRGDAPPEAVRLYLVNVRLPHVGTDLLITVNVPYPDEAAAASSMAGAECFLAAAVDGGESPEASPATAAAQSAAAAALKPGEACRAATDAPRGGHETVGLSPVGELIGEGGAAVDAPGRAAAGRVEGAGDGEGARRHPSHAAADDDDAGRDGVGAGIEALRSLLHSFAILDWSLFG